MAQSRPHRRGGGRILWGLLANGWRTRFILGGFGLINAATAIGVSCFLGHGTAVAPE